MHAGSVAQEEDLPTAVANMKVPGADEAGDDAGNGTE
jgi:hypothetical protein